MHHFESIFTARKLFNHMGKVSHDTNSRLGPSLSWDCFGSPFLALSRADLVHLQSVLDMLSPTDSYRYKLAVTWSQSHTPRKYVKESSTLKKPAHSAQVQLGSLRLGIAGTWEQGVSISAATVGPILSSVRICRTVGSTCEWMTECDRCKMVVWQRVGALAHHHMGI